MDDGRGHVSTEAGDYLIRTVVDHCRMKAQIERETDGTRLTVSIDYKGPKKSDLLGMLSGGF